MHVQRGVRLFRTELAERMEQFSFGSEPTLGLSYTVSPENSEIGYK